MNWFNYNFLTFLEVYNNIKIINYYNIFDYIWLILWLIILVVSILYLLPLIDIYRHYKMENRIKLNKKKMIRRIAMQKDIEDTIAKELKNL